MKATSRNKNIKGDTSQLIKIVRNNIDEAVFHTLFVSQYCQLEKHLTVIGGFVGGRLKLYEWIQTWVVADYQISGTISGDAPAPISFTLHVPFEQIQPKHLKFIESGEQSQFNVSIVGKESGVLITTSYFKT
jgi:hypothetical protein